MIHFPNHGLPPFYKHLIRFQMFRADFTEVVHITTAIRTADFRRLKTMYFAGKWAEIAGLT